MLRVSDGVRVRLRVRFRFSVWVKIGVRVRVRVRVRASATHQRELPRLPHDYTQFSFEVVRLFLPVQTCPLKTTFWHIPGFFETFRGLKLIQPLVHVLQLFHTKCADVRESHLQIRNSSVEIPTQQFLRAKPAKQ